MKNQDEPFMTITLGDFPDELENEHILEMQDILGECYEILVVNNWRGDLVERILMLPPFNSNSEMDDYEG